MRSIIVQMCLLSALIAPNAMAIETDKAAHFGIGYFGENVCEMAIGNIFKAEKTIGRAFFCMVILGMAASIKEAHDSMEGGKFDDSDLVHGLVGGAASALVIRLEF